jgi:Tol biopolymer transport system component
MKVLASSRRAAAVLAIIAIIVGACGSGGPSPISPPATLQVASQAPTLVPSVSPVVARPTASLAAVRPGYILMEHVGNAADGTKLADTESVHLWLIKADGSDLHELAPGQPVRKGVVGDKGAGDWSPDGNHIAFTSASQIPLIYETDVAGTTPRLISTDCDVKPVACFEFFPAYSPDGKRIAFVRLTDDGANGVLGIRDLASGKVTLLESTRHGPPKNELGGPSWSPDGRQLVYFDIAKGAEGTPPSSCELIIVNADGTGRHALKTPDLAAGDPDWSPDGSTIVFSVDPIHQWADQNIDAHPDVYEIHPDGTGLKRLTVGAGSAAPSWTSDGKILYFSERQLWLMDADGSNQTVIGPGSMSLVSDTTGYSYYDRWQPMP